GVTFTALPRAYSKIFDAAGPAPVIEHFQASRGQFKLGRLVRRSRRLGMVAISAAAVLTVGIMIGRLMS
ncbi:MAG: hypothetical protein NW205_01760, partial [Hyphomicrobiaceae bacterium]|nr:hypothetical protein [Hyphomicrobiaceae bacterium]